MKYFILGVVVIALIIISQYVRNFNRNMEKILLPSTKWVEKGVKGENNVPYIIINVTKRIKGNLWVEYTKYDENNYIIGIGTKKASSFVFKYDKFKKDEEE